MGMVLLPFVGSLVSCLFTSTEPGYRQCHSKHSNGVVNLKHFTFSLSSSIMKEGITHEILFQPEHSL